MDQLQRLLIGNLPALYHLRRQNITAFSSNKERFVDTTENIYSDSLKELYEWRELYAKEFERDPVMAEYFKNIDTTIAFDRIFGDNYEVTVDTLVETKLIESASTLDCLGLPFPWAEPMKQSLDFIDKKRDMSMKL